MSTAYADRQLFDANGLPVDYHNRPEMSSSQIAVFIEDPIRWHHEFLMHDWTRAKPTADMEFGTAVHRMIELGGWESMVKEIPSSVLNAEGHCKGKAWIDWKRENPSDVYLKPGEPNSLRVIWDHIQSNSWLADIVELSNKEVSHIWDDADFGPCRCKFDACVQNILVDWKTTSCRNARTFARDVYERAYDVRMAFYRRGFRDKYDCDPHVYLVSICTTGGMGVIPYQLPESWLDDAEARLILAVDEMQRFDISVYLNRVPMPLEQPRWSILNLEHV